MGLNLLAISAGNTRTCFGSFLDGRLTGCVAISNGDVDNFRAAIEEAYAPLSSLDSTLVLFGSVQPRITERIRKYVPQITGRKVLRVEEDVPIPIGRQLDPEAMVGDDRLLNAAAAYDTLKQACIVVDAGTAVTVDFIDGAGTFHGGAIAPGAQMMLDAMTHRAAQLPEIELAVPVEPIGHNTQQAMLAGVYYGIRGMVRELVERYAEIAGAFPTVVATGGNADLLLGGLDIVERFVPDLTLLGLAVTIKRSLGGCEEG